MEMGWPSMAASASMPPTPQARIPSPFTIGVWLSVPTQVSGYASGSSPSFTRPGFSSVEKTTRERYSRFTWCTMPVLGGTTLKLSKASCPQRRKA